MFLVYQYTVTNILKINVFKYYSVAYILSMNKYNTVSEVGEVSD